MVDKGSEAGEGESAFIQTREEVTRAMKESRVLWVALPLHQFPLQHTVSGENEHSVRIVQEGEFDFQLTWKESGPFTAHGTVVRADGKQYGNDATEEFARLEEFVVNSQGGKIKNIMVRGIKLEGGDKMSEIVLTVGKQVRKRTAV